VVIVSARWRNLKRKHYHFRIFLAVEFIECCLIARLFQQYLSVKAEELRNKFESKLGNL